MILDQLQMSVSLKLLYLSGIVKTVHVNALPVILYEPRHKKTCLRGLRPGRTQTGLPS